jgi:hypothetical protein
MNYKNTILRKFISFISAVLILLLTVVAVFYIAVETDHECHGEDCPICECIHVCESYLHETRGEELFALPCETYFLSPASEEFIPFTVFVSDTLVTDKVRMDS